MIDDGLVPAGLPPTLTLAQLQWLTGLTKERISQLSSSRVIVRTDRDCYSITSIRRLIEHQRERNVGPSKWNSARSELAVERARMAKLNREEREGKLLPADEVTALGCSITATVRNRFLALPTTTAHQVAAESKPAACEKILSDRVREILEELAALEVVAERVKADGQRRRTRPTRR